MEQTSVADKRKVIKIYRETNKPSLAADPIVKFMAKPELEKLAEKTRKEMEQASSKLDFIEAARLRDEWYELKDMIKKS